MDEFINAVKCCLRKYATFSGRAGRAEFWWFFLFGVLANLVSGMLPGMLGAFLGFVIGIALFVPSIAVGSRRLHDVDKSGWLQLLWLVPIVGWILLIYWAAQPGGPANQYGAGPDALTGEPVPVVTPGA